MNEKILNKYPGFVTIEKHEKILDQMKNKVCKIKNEKGKGSGFFCFISYLNSKKMPTLITNNHVINRDILIKGKPIMVSINNDTKNIYISLDDNRKIYTSEKYDITIIEIKPYKDKIFEFLEIDEEIFEINPIYNNESIYIIQYPKYVNEQKVVVSYGVIKDILNNDISYFCNTDYGSSGSPIFNLSNNKIIGVHKQNNNNKEFNKGTFLTQPIKEFFNNKNLIKSLKNYNSTFLEKKIKKSYLLCK